MRLHIRTLLLGLAALLLLSAAQAQPRAVRDEARTLATEGTQLIKSGDFRQAVLKLEQAHKLEPTSVDYRLGLAQALYFAEDCARASELVAPLMAGRGARKEAFQIYGNCQEAGGQRYEALETYRKGLALFPEAGILYQEMGIVEMERERWATALEYFERGIAVEPMLPGNYFFAAKRLHALGDFGWAAVYAETFILLVRDGAQVREMSKLLLRCYEDARKYDYDRAFQWQFYQVPDWAEGLADSAAPYHLYLNQAFASSFRDTSAVLDIDALIGLRRFTSYWLPTVLKGHPIAPLWAWHRKLVRAELFEAYNYWLLIDAREEDFLAWIAANESDFGKFEDWMQENGLLLSPKKPILRPKEE